jgi:hypothetical protein
MNASGREVVEETMGEFSKALDMAVDAAGGKISKKEFLKKSSDTLFNEIVPTVNANSIFSNPATLQRNVIGTQGLWAVKAIEEEIEAAANVFALSKDPDAPAMGDGLKRLGLALGSQIKTLYGAGKSALTKGGSGIKKDYQSRLEFPGLTREQSKKFVRSDKFDNSPDQILSVSGSKFANAVGPRATQALNTAGYIFEGKAIRDSIGVIDNVSKKAAYSSYMGTRALTQVKRRDVLEIDDLLSDMSQADRELVKDTATDLMQTVAPDDGGFEAVYKNLDLEGRLNKKQLKELTNRTTTYQIELGREARDNAISEVFQTPMPEGSILKKSQQVLQGMPLLGRLIFPVYSTPVNIISEVAKRTPVVPLGEGALGLPIHPQFYKDVMAGGIPRRKALSRMSAGTALFAAGASLYKNGGTNIETDEDGMPKATDLPFAYNVSDARNRAIIGAMQDQGVLPDSIVTPGQTSVSINGFEPISDMFAMGAEIQFAMDKLRKRGAIRGDDMTYFHEAVIPGLSSFAQLMKDQTFLRPMAQYLDILMQPAVQSEGLSKGELKESTKRAMNTLAESAALIPYRGLNSWLEQSVIPSATGSQPKLARREFLAETLKSRHPLWLFSDEVPASNGFGEDIELTDRWYGPFALTNKEIQRDPVKQEVVRTGADQVDFPWAKPYVRVGNGKRIDLEPLKDAEAYNELRRIAREEVNIYNHVKKMIDTRTYAEMSSLSEQRSMIHSAYRRAIDLTMERFLQTNIGQPYARDIKRKEIIDSRLRNSQGVGPSLHNTILMRGE